MAHRRPLLVAIAGPNGSGKTTLTKQLERHEWLEGVRCINADDIARDEFGDWNSPDAVLKAAQRADELREECLVNSGDFAFETVFSTSDKVDFLARARAAGYFIRLFYVGTEDPAINLRRVAQRVREQGHDVPADKIVSRYHRANANLAAGLKLTDRGYLYDNSVDASVEGGGIWLVARVRDGVTAKRYASDMPMWAQRALDELQADRRGDFDPDREGK